MVSEALGTFTESAALGSVCSAEHTVCQSIHLWRCVAGERECGGWDSGRGGG